MLIVKNGTKKLKYLKLWEGFSSDWEEMREYNKEKDDEIAGMDFSSGGDVYDYFGDEYPLASDLIAGKIFGSTEDNGIKDNYERRLGYDLDVIALDYETNWMYNMEDIDDLIKNITDED